VTGKQLRGLGAFECGHPHLEPEDRCDIRESQFTKGWGERYDDRGVDIEVGCGEEVNRSGRRAWRAGHVTTTSNADDLYWTSATADCYIITLYSGSQLLMKCGKGERGSKTTRDRLAIAFGGAECQCLDCRRFAILLQDSGRQGRTHCYTIVSQ